MRIPIENPYNEIFPLFTYVVNRKCSANWKLKGPTIYNRHNLILVYKGEAQVTCNDCTAHIKTGDLVYFKPGDYRKGHTFPDNLMECYAVDFLYTLPVFEQKRWTLHTLDLPFQFVESIDDSFLYSRLLELFSKFTKTFISQYNNKTSRGRAIFMEILYLLTQWKTGNFVYDNVQKVELAISYMTENYTKSLTLGEIAENTKISPSYLGSLFKTITGKSPITYLIDIRLHNAKQLLLDGHAVSDVAEEVGFRSLFYFSKCFKKYENVSPTQFRKIAVNEMEAFEKSEFI
ncbi:MAG: helix-turn-helix transcriptional regulator [Treponemataceae bacterium]